MSEQRVEQHDAAFTPRSDDQPREAFMIVYGEPIPDDLRAIAAELAPAGFRLLVVASREREELLRLMPEEDFLLVATTRVDEELLRAAPRLRLVQHQGVGYDNIASPPAAAPPSPSRSHPRERPSAWPSTRCF